MNSLEIISSLQTNQSSNSIQGNHPLTGLPVHFIPFEQNPGRTKILVIIGEDWYYSDNAGVTWEHNPKSIDIRKVDVVLKK